MKKHLKRIWNEWGATLSFALLFTQFGATAVGVEGASMMPALRNGEFLILPKIEGWAHRLGVGTYQRGDIVVFKPPRTATYEWTNDYRGLPLPWKYRPYLVKRIIGVPGDRISIHAGQVSVNGQPLAEPHTINYWSRYCHDTRSDLANTVASDPNHTNLQEITIPHGEYFVMGDNRSPGGSLDSRMFGPVSQQDIAARAVASVWPVLAKSNAIPPCDHAPNPEQRVQYGGKQVFNPRLLTGPEH